MCLNSQKTEVRSQTKQNLKLSVLCSLSSVFCLLFSVFCFLSSAYAESLKINLFLGDAHSRTAIEAVKEIEKSYPELKGRLKFQILTSKTLRDKQTAMQQITTSKIVFILLIMDRQAVEKVKPYIAQVIASRGKVYAVGGAYTKEHKDMGLIDDVTIKKYYKEKGLENIKNMMLVVMNRDLGLKVSYKEPVSIPNLGIYLK